MSTLTCHRAAEAMPPLIAVVSMSHVVDVCGLLLRLWETNTLALLFSLLGPFFFTPSILVARRLVDLFSWPSSLPVILFFSVNHTVLLSYKMFKGHLIISTNEWVDKKMAANGRKRKLMSYHFIVGAFFFSTMRESETCVKNRLFYFWSE